MFTITRAILWRLYYIVITVLVLMGVMYILTNRPDLYQLQYLFCQVLALIALHGYITKRCYFHPFLWKIILFMYLGNLSYEFYLQLTSQLPSHSMLLELLARTTGTDVTFSNITTAVLSTTRDGLLLPLVYALFRYSVYFNKTP